MAGAAIALLKQKPVAFSLLLLAFIRYLYKRLFRTPRGAPKVPGNFLLGNLPELAAALKTFTNNEAAQRWRDKYGDTYILWRPGVGYTVHTCNPKNIEHMLKTKFDNYVKGEFFRSRMWDLLGDGIFNVDGDKWHSQRKVASVMFTHNQFKNHIWRAVDRNCSKVVKLLLSTPPDQNVDMFNIMNRFTLDTIGEVGFAKNVGALDNADAVFLKSFDRAQQITVFRYIFPFWSLKKFLNIGVEKELKEHVRLLYDYARTTVLELQDDTRGESGDSFVGLFLKQSIANGEKADVQFLAEMVLNFLIAGRDTTAQSLAWIFFLILQHAEVEEKMLEEIYSVCGDAEITYDHMNRLPYLQAVVNEGCRLYPSVPNDVKQAVDDDTFPDGTFVPKGTPIEYSMWGQGRSKDIWGEDVLEFKPERWIGKDMPSSYDYTVFNAGPRECLGKRLAWVEMKTSLATILRSVKLTLAVPPEEIKSDIMVTLGMSSGLPCKAQPRKNR